MTKYVSGQGEIFMIDEFIERVAQSKFNDQHGFGDLYRVAGETVAVKCDVAWLQQMKTDGYAFVVWHQQ